MSEYLKSEKETEQQFLARMLLDTLPKLATMKQYELGTLWVLIDKLHNGNKEHGHLKLGKRNWVSEAHEEVADLSVYMGMQLLEYKYRTASFEAEKRKIIKRKG